MRPFSRQVRTSTRRCAAFTNRCGISINPGPLANKPLRGLRLVCKQASATDGTSFILRRIVGGVDGTRTRGLRRDRQEAMTAQGSRPRKIGVGSAASRSFEANHGRVFRNVLQVLASEPPQLPSGSAVRIRNAENVLQRRRRQCEFRVEWFILGNESRHPCPGCDVLATRVPGA